MDRLIILLSTQIIGFILVSSFDNKLHLSRFLERLYSFSDRFKPGVTVMFNIAVVFGLGVIYIFLDINTITFNLITGLLNGYCIGAYKVYCQKCTMQSLRKQNIKKLIN